MPESDGTHVVGRRSRHRVRRALAGLIAVGLAVGTVAYYVDGRDRWGLFAADPEIPRPTPAPAGLTLPPVTTPPPVADTPDAGRLDQAQVRAVLAGPLADPALGDRVAIQVAGLSDPAVLARGPAVIPASTMKLLTSIAALRELGPDHRFATTVVRQGRQVVLVGGGDPLLTRHPVTEDRWPAQADLQTLAEHTSLALKSAGVARVRLSYDTSLFTGPGAAPSWESDYLTTDVVSPITSLWVDEGREQPFQMPRSDDPARVAAAYFANELRIAGIKVAATVTKRKAPPGFAEVASVRSAPLGELVEHTLEWSDNEAAEVLARHVAIARGRPASFGGAAEAVRVVLGELGVDLTGAVIHDGSGLSRANLLRGETLTGVLQEAVAHQRLRSVVAGLPVAGFNGTLSYRFERAPAQALGQVRAKTGTLSGVNGLAGTAITADGMPVVFVIVADRIALPETIAARAALDDFAAALTRCVCRAS